MIRELRIRTGGQDLYEITADVARVVAESGQQEGLCTVFICHTSASLTIQENADPAVRRDLREWLRRLVPENDALYTHTEEGPDDMPSHIKGALTDVSLSIPILDGRMVLGTWQGIFVWEHRDHRNDRRVVIHVGP